jgi:hypothetical protein
MASGVVMLLSSGLLADYGLDPAAGPLRLWIGTLGIGFGCSMCFPCCLVLPSEAAVELTPVRLFVLNASASAGELLLPFLVGQAFERNRYAALGVALVGLELATVLATAMAWRAKSTLVSQYIEPDDESQKLLSSSTSCKPAARP